MEYAIGLTGEICDNNYQKYVGWEKFAECSKSFFNHENIRTISMKLTQLLQGVDESGRPIIVPDNTICSVMSQIYENFRPSTMDIYGRYNIPSDEPENYAQSMIDQTIEVIYNDVVVNMGMDEYNSKLSIWDTVYGDFNRQGLRQHAPIKIREKNTSHRGMVSFMNY